MPDNKQKMMIGAGIAALAAGIYFFQTDAGKKHAKKMKGWMVRMKGEVLEKIEELEEVTQPIYDKIVDQVAEAQLVAKNVPKEEVFALAQDLKRNWNSISRMANAARAARRPAKRASAPKKRSAAKKKTAKKRSR